MRGLASVVAGFAVAAMCGGAAWGGALDAQQKRIEASGGWVKTPAGGDTTTTAFVDVDNPTMYDVYLVSAASDAAGKVELRDTGQGGDPLGQLKKFITVPAFGSMSMEPKGEHLLLADLKRPLKDGDAVAITLTTDSGVVLEVSAKVRKQ